MPGPGDTSLDDTLTSHPEAVVPPEELPAAGERYQLERLLARGGQAEVHVAFDQVLGRLVAFKTPRTDADGVVTDSAERRFLREARITARLDHPNVITVHEIGRLPDARPFCTMRLVLAETSGAPRTLAQALRHGHGLRERLALLPRFLDVCNGVAHAHARGVVHRDLKPDNVVLGGPGETVVLDWGLARDRSTDASDPTHTSLDGLQTVDGQVFGTPLYMSPEHARGQRELVDERSDVWSLGVMLYELLTGATPFTGASPVEVVEAVRDAAVTPVRAREPEAPRELAAVAARALSRDRQARYPTAAQLAEDVRAFLEHRQVGVYAYSPFELVALFVRRYRTVAAVGAVSLALLVTALVAVVLSNRRAAENLAEAFVEKGRLAEAALRWDEAAAWYAAALEESPRRDARFSLRAAWTRATSAKVTRLRGGVQGVRSLAASADGRWLAAAGSDRAIRVWELPSGRLAQTLEGHTNAVTAVTFIPGEGALLSASEDGTVRRWTLDAGASEVLVSRPADAANAVAVTRDGRLAAIGFERGAVVLLELPTGTTRVLGPQQHPVYAVAFSPDGAQLASGNWLGETLRWDVVTGARLEAMQAHAGAVLAVAFSPDGTSLATAGRDTTVRVVSGKAHRTDHVRVLSGHQQKVYALSWSSDGALLASVGGDGTSRLWSALTGSPLRGASLGGAEELAAVTFIPGSSRLAWAGARGDVYLRDVEAPRATLSSWETPSLVWTPDGALLAPLLGGFSRLDPQTLTGPQWLETPGELRETTPPSARLTIDPAGSLIVGSCGGDCLAWWDTKAARVVAHSHAPGLSLEDLRFSPDGRALVTVGRDGVLRQWDPVTHTVVRSLVAHPTGAYGVAFSPDGKLVATSGYDKQIVLWNAEDLTPVRRLLGHEHGVRSVMFSPDGRTLASASWDRTVRLWDVGSGAERARLPHQDFVFGVDFRRDGAVLATGSHDGTVRLWDMATLREELRLPGDEARVTVVRFAPDGRTLFYAGRGLHRVVLEDGRALPRLADVLAATGLTLEGLALTRAPPPLVRP